MADILIYGKLKNAGGGKVADYSDIGGTPEVVQTSGGSTSAVMSQAATMAAIQQSIKEFGAFRFCGNAVSADRDNAGNVTTLYRQADLSLKFSNTEGDLVTIPGTDGETGTLGIFTVPDGYAYTVNGKTSPSVEFYRGNGVKVVIYGSDGSLTAETLAELDGVSASGLSFSDEGNYSVYSKTVTVPVIPSNGNVWQLGEREYAWNGTEWVELGFNISVDLGNVYTRAEADNHFATKSELNTKINAITPAAIGAATASYVDSAIAEALGTAESALSEV